SISHCRPFGRQRNPEGHGTLGCPGDRCHRTVAAAVLATPIRELGITHPRTQESSPCTASGQIPAEITVLTKLYRTGFGTAGAMLRMCGTFRIQSQVLEEDICRPLHLHRVSCPRRQGVRRVGGSRARLPSFTVSSCSKSSS